MHINLFLVPFVIILGLLFGNNDTKRNRRLYIYICSAVLLFVAAMRSPEWIAYSYGIDTLAYKETYENTLDMNWDGFWTSVYQRYVLGIGDSDMGYFGLILLVGLFTHNFAIFSLIADLLFFIPFCIILYRYCSRTSQIMFAFIYYLALIQVFFLGGARQMFAIGFDLMAMLAIINNKTLKAGILFLIGLTFHMSSFMFLFPLLMLWKGLSPKTLKMLHIVSFLIIPVAFVASNSVIGFLGDLSGMERYSAYQEGDLIGTFIFVTLIEALSFFCLLAIKTQDMNNYQYLRYFYVMAPFITFFGVISKGTLIRIALYYHLFLTILVPFALERLFKEKDRKIAYIITIGVLALMTIFSNNAEYYFYWQK